MAEEKLRSHLIRIYVWTCALVLLAVLLSAILLFRREADTRSREAFSALLVSLSDGLREGALVGHDALRETERKSGLALRLRDGGQMLHYNAGDGEGRRALLDRVEELARTDGYDVTGPPLSGQRRTSPVRVIWQDGRRYLGAVCVLPVGKSYRAITMMQESSVDGRGVVALLSLAYGISALLLSFLGIRLIDRALLPAQESKKRQNRFIAAASHELRSPLAVISANAATLEKAGGAAGEAAGVIQAESRRMGRLIGDMLLLASADGKSWQVSLTPLEADTLLLDVYEACQPLFFRQGRELSLSLPEEPVARVPADRERLTQVLQILLDNALSHGMTADCGRAALTLEARGGQIAIRVIDHGPGMTREQKARAFERFYRGDASRKDKRHFGLGLSVAQELVALQKGKLTVEDTPGGGCTFTVLLG